MTNQDRMGLSYICLPSAMRPALSAARQPFEAWISYYDRHAQAMKTVVYAERDVRLGGTLRSYNTAVTFSRSRAILIRSVIECVQWLTSTSGNCSRLTGWGLKSVSLPCLVVETIKAGLPIPGFMTTDLLTQPPRYPPYMVDVIDVVHPYAGPGDPLGLRSPLVNPLDALTELTAALVPEYADTYAAPEITNEAIDALIAAAPQYDEADHDPHAARAVDALTWWARAHVSRIDRILALYFQEEAMLSPFPPVVDAIGGPVA